MLVVCVGSDDAGLSSAFKPFDLLGTEGSSNGRETPIIGDW